MLDVSTLRQLLRYDHETGKLFWLERPVSMFSGDGLNGASGEAVRWNRRYANKEAGCLCDKGYWNVTIMAGRFKGHRIAWALVHGEWPLAEIDHINGERADNRLANLREVTHAENGKNSRRPMRNTSGVCGVHWRKHLGKWQARIRVNYELINLGHYDDLDAAASARKAAEATYGFHKNHGRAA
jgi:hypothetical protein